MINRILKRACTGLVVAVAILAAAASADDIQLPDMGSPADAILSKSTEAQIGRAIMRDIRNSGMIVEDPQVAEYINEIGHRIAVQANDGDYSFSFFVVNDSRINAFALPGGFIGVHTGLIEASRNEDELAGVLAHEVAHVTQRHIARAVHASSRQSMLSTALMLGAMILGAAGGDGDVVQAGVAVAQGTAAQQQINFTRSNEYEADRIGIRALAEAGFDPHGMDSFFEVMSRQETSSPDRRLPDFLRTHPVTTARISEAKSRAADYPRAVTDDSASYGIARARILVDRYDTPELAVEYFERRDYAEQTEFERYGRAVAYQRNGQHREANTIFEELSRNDMKVIAYHVGLAQTQLALESYAASRDTFTRAIELFPRNVPLVIHYAEALLQLGEAEEAHAILLDLLNNVPPTPQQVRLIARAANEAGDVAESLYYMSEFRLMSGDLIGGISFLRQALALPELQEIQRIRFEARIDFIREYMSEEQLKQLQRAQPASTSARNNT
ncbi:MAG: M48 family metalloprotease [Proteobacteria bacterium]|nr:M48 family metalloprotease [Pseudomonadota bacterium]MDA1064099.1 M48 family metalloprotease [Pseudomonadota bacterium]